MHRRTFGKLALSACAMMSISACKRNSFSDSSPALSNTQRYEKASTAAGFASGPIMALNLAYVFFDPACMHCAALWNSAKPLVSKVRIVWIPLGFLSKSSQAQSTAILAAADPLQAMDEHVTHILKNEISPSSAQPRMEQKIEANTALFKSLGADGVPYILYRNAGSGQYGSKTGGIDTAQLAALLGVAAS
ncbi:thioredoxin fold domain-containing protein [Herbaspirillum lusitanum]|uniref:Thioredoxin fold domain-containing protein n=1 Tax=Herbaspirillum lusitanum TaxID=213312 RepID=A0ABW9A2K5_9BURK